MSLRRTIRRRGPAARFSAAAAFAANEAQTAECPRTWQALPEPAGAEPLVDPLLSPRDEAIALLHATAEVEHSLMVQYLYAAYSVGSVSRDDPRKPKIDIISHLLQHIAREEMAHFATMQNLLHLLGAPLHFDREQTPFASELLPFRFKLEPLSLGSAAKYVIAESPRPLRSGGSLTDEEIKQIEGEVTSRAKASNDGICPGHVGDIFARLIWLFKNELRDDDFRRDTQRSQADWADWGFDPKKQSLDGETVEAEPSLVRQFGGNDPATLRKLAVEALQAIAEQGEGTDAGSAESESHFELFWLLYRKLVELQQMPDGQMLLLQLPINPNTTQPPAQGVPHHKMVDGGLESAREAGRIRNPRSRLWAQLFNIRYRILLTQLHHFLRIDTPVYDTKGDRLARGYLAIGVFNEMRRLKKIASKLVQLPKDRDVDPHRAGPPFELPYTTQIPDGEQNRWAMHLSVSKGASMVIGELLSGAADSADGFLLDLKAADEQDQTIMAALSAGQPLPPQTQDFPKVGRILEEGVRGFTIGAHGNFWASKDRTAFIAAQGDMVKPGDPANSRLVQALHGTLAGRPRMPVERPQVPPERITYIEGWISTGAPDSHPAYPGLMRERDPGAEAPPGPGPAVPSFVAHIRPLFRETDISCMKGFSNFDLSIYEDVKANAPSILSALDSGYMPTDGRWPQPDIDLFKAWVEGGTPA